MSKEELGKVSNVLYRGTMLWGWGEGGAGCGGFAEVGGAVETVGNTALAEPVAKSTHESVEASLTTPSYGVTSSFSSTR